MSEVIKGFIESLNEETAVIKTTAGRKILWPLDDIPADCQLGTAMTLTIGKEEADDSQDKNHQEELAKKILNDFLKR